MKNSFGLFVLVAASISVPHALAQPSAFDQARESEAKEKILNDDVLPRVSDPSSESEAQLHDDVKFNFSAIREKTAVSASVGIRKGDFLFDVTATGEVNEKVEEVELANLDGIASGFSYAVGVSRLWFNVELPDADALESVCREYAEARFGGSVPKGFCDVIVDDETLVAAEGVSEGAASAFRATFLKVPEGCCDEDAVQAATRRKGHEKAVCVKYADARFSVGKAPHGFCNSPDLGLLVPTSGISAEEAEGFNKKMDSLIDRGTVWILGARYKGNRKTFKVADSMTLEEDSFAKNGRAISLSGSLLTKQDNFWSLSYVNEDAYKGGTAKEICIPFDIEDSLICKSVVLEQPTEKKTDRGVLEFRRFFGSSFAISPKVAHNFDDDVTGAELPLYFLKGKDGALSGGIKATWRSDTRDLSLGAFVGTPLKLGG